MHGLKEAQQDGQAVSCIEALEVNVQLLGAVLRHTGIHYLYRGCRCAACAYGPFCRHI